MQQELITALEVSKRFGEVAALEKVSLTLHAGEIITIIGLNGSGKSTLLKTLIGLIEPDSGTITRKSGLRIGYMPQKLHIEPSLPLTVRDFLSLSLPRGKKAILTTLVEELGIAHLLSRPMQRVSGGETQRVMLARALLCEPELLVLDEPVQGVDVSGQGELYALISRIAKSRAIAVLMVSHDLHLVMASTNKVLCLNHHICCSGHPEQVSRDPAFVQLFGAPLAQSLAVYHHHHDHVHDRFGHIHAPGETCGGGHA